ncbi:MAG: TVP38/TMEM64 family protein, partial [bacterium]
KLAAVFGTLAAAVAILWLSGALAGFTAENVTRAVRGFGPLAPLIFVLFYALATVLLLPGSVLTIAGGLLFGPLLGMPLNVTGATLGATGAFLVARYGGRDMVERFLSGRLKAFDAKAAENGFRVIFYLRLIPLVPFNGLNLAGGLSPIRLRDYVLATALGILPGAFAYTYLGDAVGELLRGRFSNRVWIALAVFAAAALLPLLLKRVLPKPDAV